MIIPMIIMVIEMYCLLVKYSFRHKCDNINTITCVNAVLIYTNDSVKLISAKKLNTGIIEKVNKAMIRYIFFVLT